MLLMGLASSGFSPHDDHDGDEWAWETALQPPRLYEAVLAEVNAANAAGDGRPRPIWDAVVREVIDLLHWAAGPRALRGGQQLLYQTQDLRWHWNQTAASEYDVMHAWAVDGGVVQPDESERAGTDGGTAAGGTNAGGGGDGGGEGERNGDGVGEQAVREVRGALFEAAELCDKNEEEALRYALVMVEGPRRRVRDDLWNWGH